MISRRDALALPWLATLHSNEPSRDSKAQTPDPHLRHKLLQEPSHSSGPAPPAAAVAAGYTHPALIDDFTEDTAAPTMLGIYNWYPFQPYGAPVLDPSQYRVKDGHLIIDTDASGYSSGLTSINSLEPAVSRPGALACNTGKGLAFQFGYFECRMKYENRFSPRVAKGQSWPAFWANGIEGPQNRTSTYTELDFVEAYPIASSPYVSIACTMHEWTRGWNPDGTPSGKNHDHFNHSNTIGAPPHLKQDDFNVFGCLWSPKKVQWFINNYPIIEVVVGPDTPYPSAVKNAMYLVLGTGKNWPLQIDWVHVWQ
jgi:hypothetical protein